MSNEYLVCENDDCREPRARRRYVTFTDQDGDEATYCRHCYLVVIEGFDPLELDDNV